MILRSNFLPAPYPYFGNKFKLLSIIFDLIKSEITTIYDLFGGSGVVSLNAKYFGYSAIYNDVSGLMYGLQLIIANYRKEFNDIVDDLIKKYDLTPHKLNSHKRRYYKNNIESYFKWLAENIDSMSQYDKYSHLICYSRLQVLQSTRNSVNYLKGKKLNIGSAGNYVLTKLSNIYPKLDGVFSKSYLEFDNDDDTDCFYLDPPYLTTNTANYNNQNVCIIGKT